MAHPSFGSGWPRCSSPTRTLVRRDGLRIPVHAELVQLLGLLFDVTEALGYNIKPGQTWGKSCRAISGTRKPSNHSWGTAVDINAPSNPMMSASWHRSHGTRTIRGRRLRTDMTEQIVRLFESHGFGWGGMYPSMPDPMHFEFNGTVADARRYTASAKTFFGQKKPVSSKPLPPQTAPTPLVDQEDPMLLVKFPADKTLGSRAGRIYGILGGKPFQVHSLADAANLGKSVGSSVQTISAKQAQELIHVYWPK